MAIKFYKTENGQYHYHCPGCECLHFITVDKSQTPCWDFNGDVEKPTVSPSVRIGGTVPITDDEHARIMAGEKIEPQKMVCHYFIRDGFFEYCSDTTHKFSGKTVEVPDWDSD